jgi:LPXTG-motif cell wall-anchored protein
VSVDYSCKTPIGVKSAVSEVAVSAVPAAGGSSYAVTMTFTNGVSSSPVELGPGAMKPSALLNLGGADSGTVKVVGPGNAAAVPPDTPITIGSLTGTYTPGHNGTVTLAPGVLTIVSFTLVSTCTPADPHLVALSLPVTGAAGAPATGAPPSAPALAALPQTGAADDTVAFGLFGGTVLLCGVGGGLVLALRSRRVRV